MPIIINEFEIILAEQPQAEQEQDQNAPQPRFAPALSPQTLEELLRRRLQRQVRLTVY